MKQEPIRFDLTIEEANLVLEALGQLPFVRVFNLIGKLQDAARAQVEAQESPTRNEPAASTNGERTNGSVAHA